MRANGLGRAIGLGLVAVLAACTPTPTPTPPPPTTPAPRPFTVITTEAPRTLDPAGISTQADAAVVLAAFSRLMVVHPTDAELKPDLATDCLYTSATVYECELPKGLQFANGHALTASDVQFSVQRARRLSGAPGAARQFEALQRIEVVDDVTIRFVLRWPDPGFGHTLASPMASIVDEELYDPDALRPASALPEGSGPYRLVTIGEDEFGFERFKEYQGAQAAAIDRVRLKVVADSAAAEAAISEKTAEVVWRSLSDAALARLRAADKEAQPYTRVPDAQAPVSVTRLEWNPASTERDNAELRRAVALSLQADRTHGSLVPSTTTNAADTFETGGSPEIPALPGERPRLTLTYPGRAPGLDDQARRLRDRIEAGAGISVQVVADEPAADLRLTDEPAWVNTALAWLQPYLHEPLAGSRQRIGALVEELHNQSLPAKRTELLKELQELAARDLTVLPVAQGAATVYLAPGVSLTEDPYGPGYQLGLWGFQR